MTTKCILDGRMSIYSTYIWSLSSYLLISSDTRESESLEEPKQGSSFMAMAGGTF